MLKEQTYKIGLHLPSLSIKRFRGIADLSIPRLGHATLIAGKNNTGKTSILEAIRLLTEGATPEVIREILQFREENASVLSEDWSADSDWNFFVSALFHGFPQLSEETYPISIASGDGSSTLNMQVEWFSERTDGNRVARLASDRTADPFSDNNVPVLVVDTGQERKVYRIDNLDRRTPFRPPRRGTDSTRPSSRLVGAMGTQRTASLGPLWDNVSLTENEPYVVDALKVVDPRISAFSMIGDQSIRSSRTAVVLSEAFGRRVPLRSFGEGMNRLLGIILSLVNVKDGLLLIDEFENGMHYTVQIEAWRMIFRIARKLNVQVVATTHSIDCVAAFRQAAAEHEEINGLLIRIDKRGDLMRSVEYTEEDLEVAIRNRIEVR